MFPGSSDGHRELTIQGISVDNISFRKTILSLIICESAYFLDEILFLTTISETAVML
jgi:hypothetical protein